MRVALRRIEPHADVARLSDRQVSLRIATLERLGRVGVAEIQPVEVMGSRTLEKETRTSDASETSLHSISYQVVDDLTSEPLPGVELLVTLPNGKETPHTTDGDGMVRIEGLAPGRCDVRAKAGGKGLLEVLAYVGFGLLPITVDAPTGEPAWARPNVEELDVVGQRKLKPKATAIAKIRPYRVRTGDTLESIGERFGLARDEILQFNFGTTDRMKVRRMLAREVGCTWRDLKTGDFVFRSEDEPGILYLPEPFRAEGQRTDNDYVVRVKRIAPHHPPFVYSL